MHLESFTQLLVVLNVFKLRFEYSFFHSIAKQQLAKILGEEGFIKFCSTKVHPPPEYYEHFTLARIIALFCTQPILTQP